MEYLRGFRFKERAKTFFTANIIHPLESIVLILHYKLAALVFFLLFSAVVSSFYAVDPMECILKYDRSEPHIDFEELCLTYPYTYHTYGNHHWSNRVFALHYKWIHWAMLFLVGAYHIPLFIRKYHENKDLNLYLTMLKNDDQEELQKQLVTDFIHNFVYTQQGLYRKVLIIHFWCLLVDVASFGFFDVVLQNRFARLIPVDYPFHKWPQYFNDTVSVAFPQFVECTIGEDMMIISRRQETLGCRLTLMPMYEKIFICMWVMFCLLALGTLISLFYYLVLGVSTSIRKQKLYIVREENNIKFCLDNLSVGDVIALMSLKRAVSSELFRHALQEIRRL